MEGDRRGLGYAAAAYFLWGAFPLYWPLLQPSNALEVLAHRVCWSAITLSLLVVGFRRLPQLRQLWTNPRQLTLIAIAAVVLSINWGVFIYGVNAGRVVEVSLGYFINPLVTVALGVLVMGERLRRLQWVAMLIAGFAVIVLTADYGRPPWVALTLAVSFGCYALVKKQAAAGSLESLATETLVLTPLATAYVVWLIATGTSTFGTQGPGHAVLLMTTGLVTAVPLLLFGAAATRIPLVSIGLLQYIGPSVQFVIGVWWFGEDMPPSRWIGFGLVWVALALLTTEIIRHHRRQPAPIVL